MNKPNFLKSKQEKELEARIAVRQGIRDLEKVNKKLEKKKDEMLAFAREAREKGVKQQYAVATSGLKMIINYQKRSEAMVLQAKMAESMRDLTGISSKFVNLMGTMGREVAKVANSTNFARNQMEFEKGMASAEMAMDQLESFMEDAGMGFADVEMSDDELNEAIEALISADVSAPADDMEEELKAKLNSLNSKLQGVKE